MKPEKLFLLVKILGGFGLLLSIYLLWQQFFHPVFQPCYVNSFINCNAIITGPVAKTFGIPTPLIGFIGYIIVLFAAFVQNKKLLISMASFGLVFCLSIAYIEIVQLRVLCPVCIMCQVTMGLIWILSFILFKKKYDSKQQTT